MELLFPMDNSPKRSSYNNFKYIVFFRKNPIEQTFSFLKFHKCHQVVEMIASNTIFLAGDIQEDGTKSSKLVTITKEGKSKLRHFPEKANTSLATWHPKNMINLFHINITNRAKRIENINTLQQKIIFKRKLIQK